MRLDSGLACIVQLLGKRPQNCLAPCPAARCVAGLLMVSYRSRILLMPRGNPSPKLAITIDPDVHENVLAAAAQDGLSVSAWMTMAAREALQRKAGLAAVSLWEKQHGRLTTEEMDAARHRVRAQLGTQPGKARKVRRPHEGFALT